MIPHLEAGLPRLGEEQHRVAPLDNVGEQACVLYVCVCVCMCVCRTGVNGLGYRVTVELLCMYVFVCVSAGARGSQTHEDVVDVSSGEGVCNI